MRTSIGGSLTLILAVPLFAYVDIGWVMAARALVILATDVVGLIRSGFTEPEVPALQLAGVGAADWEQERWINQWSLLWETGSRSVRCDAT